MMSMAKRRMLLSVAMACVCVVPVSVASAAEEIARAAQAKVPPTPLILRGTLGGATIQMTLRPKTDMEGWEGNYFLFGHSARILLAGEVEEDEIALEESENGTDVSGQWNGKFVGKTLSGEWMSSNGSVIKPFNLKILPETERAAKQSGRSSQ